MAHPKVRNPKTGVMLSARLNGTTSTEAARKVKMSRPRELTACSSIAVSMISLDGAGSAARVMLGR